jgi:dTMP kinase
MTAEAPRRGLFVTLEGPDGSGKTAQAERIRAAVAADGWRVLLVREPGGTAAGERIRAILMDRAESSVHLTQRADALLFMAARAQLVERVIEPALAEGTVVISDRYLDSTLAYQGYGGELGLEELLPVGRFATGGLRPDLTILFDVPVEVGLARKSAAEVNRFEAHFDHAFHERVRAGYLALAADDPDRYVVIDASAPEPDVFAAALAMIIGRLRAAEAPAG